MCQMCTHSVFCVKKRTCGKEFSSKAAMDEHALCHKAPRYRCIICGSGFQFQYQLNSHSNGHTNFQIKCHYSRCGQVYKSESEYKRHYKLHRREYQEYHVPHVGNVAQK